MSRGALISCIHRGVLMCCVILSATSCVVMHERTPDGGTALYTSIGGKGAYRRGVGLVHAHEQSFRHFTTAATTVAATAAAASGLRLTEGTKQVTTREATKQHAAATQATTQQVISSHRLEATKAALGTGGAAVVAPVAVSVP